MLEESEKLGSDLSVVDTPFVSGSLESFNKHEFKGLVTESLKIGTKSQHRKSVKIRKGVVRHSDFVYKRY